MNEKEFYWFCNFLNWSTKVSLALMLVASVLMPFAFFVADDKPWLGIFGFIVFVFAFYNNRKDKVKFIAGEEVSKGYHGTTGVMFSLWVNIWCWFFYILIEMTMIAVSIGIFLKAIWPS
jgi:hypothetical protein